MTTPEEKREAMLKLVTNAEVGWLPGVGNVVPITFTYDQRNELKALLSSAAGSGGRDSEPTASNEAPVAEHCQLADLPSANTRHAEERRALAIDVFIDTIAGPAFSREELRKEAEAIKAGVYPYTPSTEARMVTDAMVERALAAANDAMIDARRHWHPDDRKAVRAMLEAAINPTFANIVDAARAEADRRGTPSSTTRSEVPPYMKETPPDAPVCVYTGGRCNRPWCKKWRGCDAWEAVHTAEAMTDALDGASSAITRRERLTVTADALGGLSPMDEGRSRD